jgi:arylsulfatase A-like enzyme
MRPGAASWAARCANLPRRLFCALLVAALGLGCADGGTVYARVVLVTIDTLRADHLASYGYPREVSPFIDGLASRGVRFSQAMATMAHTAPSHASMFTGLSPTLHGVRQNGQRLPAATPTLAAALRAAGWETAAFASAAFLGAIANGFETVSAAPRPAGELTRAAIAWIAERDASRPFFLWVHYYDVHEWYHALAPESERAAVRAAGRFDQEPTFEQAAAQHGWPTAPGPGGFEPLDWGLVPAWGKVRPFRVGSRDEALAWIDSYDARIARVDREIRRLFEFVEALRPPEPVLWIVTSDHGEGLGGHGLYGHGEYVYAEALRVPLIFFASDRSLPPTTVDALVSLVDLAPTLAALLGLAPAALGPASEGVSLLPLLRGAGGAAGRPVFAERRPLDDLRRALGWQHDEVYALQAGSRKYIRVEGGRDEFYDLASDPLELRNRIDEPIPERDELRRLLDAKLASRRGSAPSAEPPDARYVEELRALGYVK